MKKCLLITWLKNYNYGTALQAFSLKNILEDISICNINVDNIDKIEKYDCEIINFKPKRKYNIYRKIKKVLSINAYKVKKNQIRDNYEYNLIQDKYEIRKNACNAFFNNNFKMTNYITKKSQFVECGNSYDIYIAGSDQIWNPDNYDEVYFLNWVNKNKKKISYGSSLSSSVIPKYMTNRYKKGLNNFDYISIRDVAPREKLEKISGKKVYTVVDPVILLGSESMSNIIDHLEIDIDDYAFAYFLGNNVKHRKIYLNLIKEKGYNAKAITCVSKESIISDKLIEQYADWDVDPLKFAKYIKKAKIVLTDSFHAVVLSILFHKDFVVFEKDSNRPQQNNRILELLALTGLSDRWNNETKIEETISEEKWSDVDERIESARKKSLEYLIGALYEENNN